MMLFSKVNAGMSRESSIHRFPWNIYRIKPARPKFKAQEKHNDDRKHQPVVSPRAFCPMGPRSDSSKRVSVRVLDCAKPGESCDSGKQLCKLPQRSCG